METVFGLFVETAKMMPSPQPGRLVTGELTNDQLLHYFLVGKE